MSTIYLDTMLLGFSPLGKAAGLVSDYQHSERGICDMFASVVLTVVQEKRVVHDSDGHLRRGCEAERLDIND